VHNPNLSYRESMLCMIYMEEMHWEVHRLV
jgi:hypothetical protein